MADETHGHEAKGKLSEARYLPVEPRLATQLDQRRRRLLRLRALSSPPPGWVVDRLAALDQAIDALSKAPGRAALAEVAWIAVHQVRHALCLHDRRDTLIEIAHEVQYDLTDNAVPPQSLPADVPALITSLVQEGGEPTTRQRNELYALSLIAAARRESDWNRVNHLVGRRFRAALTVVAVLVILVVVLPFGFEHISVGQGLAPFVYSWAREAGCIVCVLACGALGALLSVLLGHERLQISSVEHHLVVSTHRLRPIVGAASALVFFILWESGVLQMADAGHRKAGLISGTLLLMAVVAGFSERLLLGQIEKLSAAFQSVPIRTGEGEREGDRERDRELESKPERLLALEVAAESVAPREPKPSSSRPNPLLALAEPAPPRPTLPEAAGAETEKKEA
jgi:hypothetical protein